LWSKDRIEISKTTIHVAYLYVLKELVLQTDSEKRINTSSQGAAEKDKLGVEKIRSFNPPNPLAIITLLNLYLALIVNI